MLGMKNPINIELPENANDALSQQITKDVVSYTFNFLSPTERLSLESVCKSWMGMIENHLSWLAESPGVDNNPNAAKKRFVDKMKDIQKSLSLTKVRTSLFFAAQKAEMFEGPLHQFGGP